MLNYRSYIMNLRKLYSLISDKITVTGDMPIDEIMDIINNSEVVKYFKLDKYK